jgi:hypothetical protein
MEVAIEERERETDQWRQWPTATALPSRAMAAANRYGGQTGWYGVQSFSPSKKSRTKPSSRAAVVPERDYLGNI